jgi:hypothetical protein
MRATFCCVMTLASGEFLNREDNRRCESRVGPKPGGFFVHLSCNIDAAIDQLEASGSAVIQAPLPFRRLKRKSL